MSYTVGCSWKILLPCFFKYRDKTVTGAILYRMVVTALKNHLLLVCVCMHDVRGRQNNSELVLSFPLGFEAGSLLFLQIV